MTVSRRTGGPGPRQARPTATPVVPVLAVAVILMGWLVTQVAHPLPAFAHNSLVSSVPADGATVATAPDAVTLTFDEPVGRRFGLVVVTGPGGRKVQQGALQVTGETARQPLGRLGPAGTYRVSWRVVSADGHPVSGAFAFRLRTGDARGTSKPTPTEAPTSAASTPPASRSDQPDGVAFDSSSRRDPANLALPLTAGLAALALVIGLGIRSRRRAQAAPGGEGSEQRDTPESRDSSDGD